MASKEMKRRESTCRVGASRGREGGENAAGGRGGTKGWLKTDGVVSEGGDEREEYTKKCVCAFILESYFFTILSLRKVLVAPKYLDLNECPFYVHTFVYRIMSNK
jgi:hypothetical protein